MMTSTDEMNYGKYSNAEFDALMTQAAVTLDLEKRAAIMKRAEQIILDEVPILPLMFSVSRNLVAPHVEGWVDNVRDVHRSRYLRLNRDGG